VTEERSTVRSGQLGDALRSAMDYAGLSGKRTAQMLGWSESRVSRFLTGKLSATEVEISAMLAVYGVTGDERDGLLCLARETTKLTWSYEEALRTLTDHQNKAVRITELHTLTVPGLLQTEGYARAVVSRMVNAPNYDHEAFLASLLARQELFNRDNPPLSTFFIHELALHLPVGGPLVMSEQLHHLLRMSVRSQINLRLIPAAIGAHAGLAGSCCLMEFTEFGPVAFVEEEISGYFLEEPAEIAAYHRTFTALGAVALDQSQSKTVITRLAVDRYGHQHNRKQKSTAARATNGADLPPPSST
jgi:transcriptional regulator with XRE-family HTH domain